MKKIIAFTGVIVFTLGVMSFKVTNDRLFEISKNIEIFVNIYKEINANYVDDLDPGKLMRTGIDAMLESLDPYTNYISESQVENYRLNVDGKYNGIGARLAVIDDYITIAETHENSSIQQAGLQIGDQIIEVNGLSTKGKSIEDADILLRGVSGTKLNLKIKRPYPSKTMDVTVDRVDNKAKNVPYSGFVSDEVGYINLTTFTADAGKNVRKALNTLKKERPSIEGVIIDLRNNGGGLLREAVNLLNIFIPKDVQLVSTRGKVKERDKIFSTMKSPADLDIPVVVLVNKSSASASEIVSGAIQDLDRGVVMGQRTYGKGLVQNQKEVGYNSRVKLTTSKYYIPSGRCIQSVEYKNGEPVDIPDDSRSVFKTKAGRKVLDGGGVTPDIKLELTKNDPVVQALLDQHMIFKYVNKHVASQKDTMALENIAFDNFQDFNAFIKSENFDYELDLEKKLKEIKESDGAYVADVMSDINSLEGKIKSLKQKALEENKTIILTEIKKEIASRYYYSKGKVFASLDNDPEIAEAISLIGATDKYNSILK